MLTEWKSESITYTDIRTDRLTGVGARDTCVSKKFLTGYCLYGGGGSTSVQILWSLIFENNKPQKVMALVCFLFIIFIKTLIVIVSVFHFY